MSHAEDSVVLSDPPSSDVQSPEFVTKCHRNALEQLSLAFEHQRPLAILIGQGKSTSRFVIRKFLSRLDAETAVARITAPCANATEFMGRIISAVGFQPKDMTIGDLESVFSMFLSFQKAHRRRTVICVEEVDECEWWVLDKIKSFVETEREGPFGLTVVLSGQPALKELLTRRPLRSVVEFAGKQIFLAPFTLPETREYVRRRVEGAGIASVDEVFEYHAIPMLHELCGGVPDAVGELVGQCRLQAEEEGVKLVTAEIVKRAYESQRVRADQVYGEDQAATVNFTELPPRPGRLIVQLSGQDVREIALRRGNILIGRSEMCDICIDSKIVSRHHALISYRPDGAVIVDLGSTNGTCVDGYPIKEQRLAAGDTITVGECRIEYILDDALDAKFQDAEFSANLELHS